MVNEKKSKIDAYRLLILGFGSTSDHPIVDTAIHYDSGCVLNEYGALIHFSRHASGTLSVPSIYVVYFSTFGALVSDFPTVFHSTISIV